jgi:hypothetical protein
MRVAFKSSKGEKKRGSSGSVPAMEKWLITPGLARRRGLGVRMVLATATNFCDESLLGS